MEKSITIGLNVAKHVFHAHGAGELGQIMFSRKLSRAKTIVFAGQPRCVVALECRA